MLDAGVRIELLKLRNIWLDQYLMWEKLKEKGWTLLPSAVNKRTNLGTTNIQRIDLALEMGSTDIISPIHCLTSLKIAAELWCHQVTFSGTCVCLLFWECLTLFYSLWRGDHLWAQGGAGKSFDNEAAQRRVNRVFEGPHWCFSVSYQVGCHQGMKQMPVCTKMFLSNDISK